MTLPPPYNDRVLAHFATPAHAGELAARYPVVVTGEAAESASGCRVVLAAGSDGRRYLEVRFRVFGCPHLVAAAEEWCRRVEGRPAGPGGGDMTVDLVAELMDVLGVPVEKTGRLLVLEDAWRALEREFARKRQMEPNTAENDQ